MKLSEKLTKLKEEAYSPEGLSEGAIETFDELIEHAIELEEHILPTSKEK